MENKKKTNPDIPSAIRARRNSGPVAISSIIPVAEERSKPPAEEQQRKSTTEKQKFIQDVRKLLENAEVTACYSRDFELKKFLDHIEGIVPSRNEDCYIIVSWGRVWKLFIREIKPESIPPGVELQERIRLEGDGQVLYLYPFDNYSSGARR